MTEDTIRDALRAVIDPELGINVVDLGLVYGVEIDGDRVRVVMTVTTPACPLGEYFADVVRSTVQSRLPGVRQVDVEIVSEPRWNPSMMSEDAKSLLSGGTR